MNDPRPWLTLATRRVFSNRWLSVALDEVALPDGRRYEYTRLEPGGIGVGVLGFNAAGEVLLEREYRHGVGEVIWQVPGGLADAGESWQDAGLRELLEETGYAPARISPETVRYLGVVWDNPALGVAQSHLYAVWGVTPVAEARPDVAELVTVHWKSQAWLKEAVCSGEIKDRVLVAAVAFLLLHGWLA